MKKVFERIIEGILTCSGFVTSITILLIVLFLFTEAFGLFSSKVIEEGYVLALNKDNKVSELTPMQIKEIMPKVNPFIPSSKLIIILLPNLKIL